MFRIKAFLVWKHITITLLILVNGIFFLLTENICVSLLSLQWTQPLSQTPEQNYKLVLHLRCFNVEGTSHQMWCVVRGFFVEHICVFLCDFILTNTTIYVEIIWGDKKQAAGSWQTLKAQHTQNIKSIWISNILKEMRRRWLRQLVVKYVIGSGWMRLWQRLIGSIKKYANTGRERGRITSYRRTTVSTNRMQMRCRSTIHHCRCCRSSCLALTSQR